MRQLFGIRAALLPCKLVAHLSHFLRCAMRSKTAGFRVTPSCSPWTLVWLCTPTNHLVCSFKTNRQTSLVLLQTLITLNTYAYMHMTARKYAAKWIRPTSNHLVKWFGWNRFECAFSVDATSTQPIRIECAFNAH